MLLGEKLQSAEGRFLMFDKPAGDDFAHEYLMLSENEIKGLLSFGIQSRNGKESYVYNISGMQSLTELYLQREIVHRELLVIFKGLSTVFEGLSEYLLDGSGLMLDPEYIFEDLNRELFFIFIPGAENEPAASMRELALFLIKRTDHRDKEAVRDAYDFYKRVYAGDYSTKRYFERETAGKARDGKQSYIKEVSDPVNPSVFYREPFFMQDDGTTDPDDPNAFYGRYGEAGKSVSGGHDETWGSEPGRYDGTEGSEPGRYGETGEKLSGRHDETWESDPGKYDEAEGSEPVKHGETGEAITGKKSRVSERTVYGACAAGLILLASFITLAAFYSPEGIGRIFYKSEAVAVSGIIGAILVLIPVLYSNKNARSKNDIPTGEMKGSYSGTESGLYYLSADREGEDKSILIKELPFTIGKAADCSGIIDSRAVSRHHARIDKRKGGCYITDLGSTNGTSLGGIKLEPHRPELLSCGDEILFADRTYYYWKA